MTDASLIVSHLETIIDMLNTIRAGMLSCLVVLFCLHTSLMLGRLPSQKK